MLDMQIEWTALVVLFLDNFSPFTGKISLIIYLSHFGSSAAEYWCIVLAHDIMQGCIPSVIQHDEHSIYVI